MTFAPRPTRRAALGLVALLPGACVESGSRAPPAASVTAEPTPAVQPAAGTGPTLGSGRVKVALILPLTGAGQGAVAAASLRNAAELSLSEFQEPDLTILVRDDRGTAEGAREAATAAIAEGAELVIGPLFANTVAAAGAVARAAGRPMIAFSTDANVAAPGLYLLSFMAQSEVERVVDHAVAQGRRSFAALVPETIYGNVVEAQFREAAARRGARVAALERYAPGQPQPAAQRLAGVIGGPAPSVDALLLPETGENLAAVAAALVSAGFDAGRVKPLGTGVWNDPRAFGIAALQGGWFAAPETTGYAAFAGRYRARFGGDPTRIATLAYDAVSLAAALARQPAPGRFAVAALTAPTGFAGLDGVFRFRPDGTNERALAILEIRNGATLAISPAPRSLASAG